MFVLQHLQTVLYLTNLFLYPTNKPMMTNFGLMIQSNTLCNLCINVTVYTNKYIEYFWLYHMLMTKPVRLHISRTRFKR